jgi:hypothetical protein
MTFKPSNTLGDKPYGVYGSELKSMLPPEPTPPVYRDNFNPWRRFVSKWFFEGLPAGTKFFAKEGIDGRDVFKHVSAVLRSYELAHEEKEAVCAYLLDLWLDRVEMGAGVFVRSEPLHKGMEGNPIDITPPVFDELQTSAKDKH